MNKKVIFVILLFIGISFIVYSFANPLNQENDLDGNKYYDGNNDIMESKKDDDNDDIIDSDDILDEEKDETEEQPDDSSLIVDSSVVTNKPSSSYNKRPSTGGSTSGNTGGSNSGSTGGNGGSTENQPTPPVTPPPVTPVDPPVEPEKPTIDYSNITVEQPEKQPSDGTQNNIQISQNGSQIVLSGRMAAQERKPEIGINSPSYIVLQIVAPKAYSDAELSKMNIKTNNGEVLTQEQNNILASHTINGKPYFTLTQEFMTGKQYLLTVDWGNGVPITYTIICNITVVYDDF